ncbi:hypothetical protein AX17_006422 [Amanita inopinata Kibby_2008]|nr:hypothetical protein AX17_006422 [Amanita inopinata Kibby_2008]
MSFDLFASLTAFLLIFHIYRRDRKNASKSLPLPPGPKKRFLVGNLMDMPKEHEWITYHKWCKELNTDILHLSLLGTSVIVLDTAEVATELLERRSTIYSGRPQLPMIHDLMGWDFALGFKNYGDNWRAQRKLTHHSFHATAAEKFRPHLIRAARGFLRRMLIKPDVVVENVKYMTGEIVILVTYGLDTLPENDPYIKLVEKGVRPVLHAAIPGTFLVDALPALKYVPEWMPGAGFKKKARVWRSYANDMVEEPYRAAKELIDAGSYKPSFISESLARLAIKKDVALQDEIKSTAGSMYAAGVDTTTTAVVSCILGLLSRPDVLQKARAEIDAVIPAGELPTFEDEERLPYITAVCMEALRWRGIGPIGIPHLLAQDDVYKGYGLPQGTLIIANIWAMLHNEDLYPEPFTFKPERFMRDGKINKDVRNPSHAVWGFGRRVCPGRYLALSSLWITVASLIAAFDIRSAVDSTGKTVDPEPEIEPGIVCMPKSCVCSIRPRSKKHEQMVSATENEEIEY